MLKLVILFLALVLVAVLFSFGGLVGAVTSAVQILFFVFLVVFLASLAMTAVRR